MDTVEFWANNASKVTSIMESIDFLSDNTFVWVTNLKNRSSWCSEKMRNYFGLNSQVIFKLEEELKKYIYNDDIEEYTREMGLRIQGKALDRELLCRMCGIDGIYHMFSFCERIIYGEDGEKEYLIVSIKNEEIPSLFDPLTDMYSYARYVRDLDWCITTGCNATVLQIELDGFNTFNLIYGLDYSKNILQRMAWKLIYMTDPNKAVYRLEGERFVFILRQSNREELIEFEQRVRNVLEKGVTVDNKRIPIKMNAGGIILEDYYGDSSSVRGQVAYAVDHSKQKHQGELVIFNDEVKTSTGANLELMRVIHQSVLNGCKGFYVEYQPIVTADKGEIVGAEALVRWCHEEYGKVPPGMFIEWLETDPAMYDLGIFVLKTALCETKKILEFNPDFFIDVNVSARQLERMEFREDLLKILKETDFPADHLCLELTERCRDFPIDKLKSEVEFFQNCGIKFAMDDYGTGSASSSIIMNVPMDEIKLDMSFIRNIIGNPKNQEMVRSILQFAQKSNMNTCLEGVENEELQDYLREYNATWFQGYYYAKPLSLELLEDMVKAKV